MDEKVFTSIERRLLQDGKPVSAKFLAVQHKIHISKARTYMESFLKRQENEGNDALPYVLYILMGAIGHSNGESQISAESMDLDGVNERTSEAYEGMYLSDADHLEETKARFLSEPSVSIYALNPPLPSSSTEVQKVASISQLQIIQHELKNTPEYVKSWNDEKAVVGAIAPPSDVVRSEQFKTSSTGIVPVESKKAIPKAVEPKSAVKNEPKPIKKEVEEKMKKEAPKKKAVVAADDEEDEDDGPIGYNDKIPADVPVSKGGAASKKADKPLSAQEEKRRRQKQELIDMMDEDRDGNADPEVPMAESTATSMMGGEERETEKEAIEPGKKRRVQKERKVIRKEKYTNEKGYRMTRDVEEVELYTTDESDGEASAKPSKNTKAIKKVTQAKDKSPPVKIVKEEPKKTEAEKKVQSTNEHSDPKAPAKPPQTVPAKKTTTKPADGQRKLSSFFTKKT